MSKHFKNIATKAFAVAVAGGLSLNGFALAVGASTRTRSPQGRRQVSWRCRSFA